VVVEDGLAVTLAHVVHDKPVAGDQLYVSPPVAVSVVEAPLQMAVPEPALIVGSALTVTVTAAVLVQPLASVPVTVYVFVVVGLAAGLAQAVHDRPVEGNHI
jgi:hypothetical protein